MLGRRNLRIKVMQTLFGREMSSEIPLQFLEGQLKSNIQRSSALYLTLLEYICAVCRYANTDKDRRSGKYLKTNEDINLSTLITRNRITTAIAESVSLQASMKKEKVAQWIDEELVRKLYLQLVALPRYKEYAKLSESTLDADIDMVGFLVKNILTKNSDLDKHLEENFMNVDDDSGTIWIVIQKYISGFEKTGVKPFEDAVGYWEAEQPFAYDLLKKNFAHNDELRALILPYLKNWDPERVAVMDFLILKMALCELLYCPTVPVKVTINEYIDISKFYSTPKSKDFVNGVLDKIKNQLQEDGSIKKQGRGLVE